MSIKTVYLLLPEIVVLLVAVWTYVGGTFTKTRYLWSLFALGGLAVAASHLIRQGAMTPEFTAPGLIEGPLAVDRFSYALRAVALGVGALFILILSRSAADGPTGETIGSLLVMVAGLMLACSANNLVLLFVSLELISIPTYILLFIGRRDRSSPEVTAKYFFLSILSSAILLYGFSFLYGVSGSMVISTIAERVGEAEGNMLATLAGVLIFAGLAFKIAAVPFHFYAPDVYQGTTNANAGLLAVVPKIAGVVVLVRLIACAMPGMETILWQVALAVAMITMTLGNVLALCQHNLRRMLAYSSIAHGGYMLLGLATGLAGAASGEPNDGVGAMLFYLLMYVLATTGTFAALSFLSRRDQEVDSLDELAGLGRTHPLIAALLAIFMLSLAGIPPLAGFFGKLTLFLSSLGIYFSEPISRTSASIQPWFLALAVVAAINAAIGAAYYLRVVAVMYFRPQRTPPKAEGGWGALAATVICGVLVITAGISPGGWISDAQEASQAASGPRQRRPAVRPIGETELPAVPISFVPASDCTPHGIPCRTLASFWQRQHDDSPVERSRGCLRLGLERLADLDPE